MKKIEREVKFLDVDVKDVVKRLKALDARKGYEGVMHTASYEIVAPGIPLIVPSRRGEGLVSMIHRQKREFLETIVSDTDDLREILTQVGFTRGRDGYVLPTSITSLADRNFRLRFRSKGRDGERDPPGELTLKKKLKLGEVRESPEYEAMLQSYHTGKEMLLLAGLRAVRQHDKRRTEYLLPDDIRVTIDTVPGVPTYIEIESTNASHGVRAAIAEIARTATALGFRMQDASMATTRELRAMYKR